MNATSLGDAAATALTRSRVGPHWALWQNAGRRKHEHERLVLGERVGDGELVEARIRLRVGRDLAQVAVDIGAVGLSVAGAGWPTATVVPLSADREPDADRLLLLAGAFVRNTAFQSPAVGNVVLAT